MRLLLQITSASGFSSLNGTGTGLLEGLLDVGEFTSHEDDSWITPCPAGSRVDGYQVVKGGLIYQIRPRCSCQNCGASSGGLQLLAAPRLAPAAVTQRRAGAQAQGALSAEDCHSAATTVHPPTSQHACLPWAVRASGMSIADGSCIESAHGVQAASA